MKLKQILFSFIMLSMLASCSSVTIIESGRGQSNTEPTYKDTKAFYLGGAIPGSQDVSIKEACGEKKAKQVVMENEFLDGFFTIITFGIYSPRTVKIWCQED